MMGSGCADLKRLYRNLTILGLMRRKSVIKAGLQVVCIIYKNHTVVIYMVDKLLFGCRLLRHLYDFHRRGGVSSYSCLSVIVIT